MGRCFGWMEAGGFWVYQVSLLQEKEDCNVKEKSMGIRAPSQLENVREGKREGGKKKKKCLVRGWDRRTLRKRRP